MGRVASASARAVVSRASTGGSALRRRRALTTLTQIAKTSTLNPDGLVTPLLENINKSSNSRFSLTLSIEQQRSTGLTVTHTFFLLSTEPSVRVHHTPECSTESATFQSGLHHGTVLLSLLFEVLLGRRKVDGNIDLRKNNGNRFGSPTFDRSKHVLVLVVQTDVELKTNNIDRNTFGKPLLDRLESKVGFGILAFHTVIVDDELVVRAFLFNELEHLLVTFFTDHFEVTVLLETFAIIGENLVENVDTPEIGLLDDLRAHLSADEIRNGFHHGFFAE